METTEQTIQQIDRAIKKIAEKFPSTEETSQVTDIHLRVSQDSGELRAYNDDGDEITRIVVEQWIGYESETFFDEATNILRKELKKLHNLVDNMGVLKPYSFVLEDGDDEDAASNELYVADDDTVIVSDGNLMEGLDEDLNNFFDDIMKEDDGADKA